MISWRELATSKKFSTETRGSFSICLVKQPKKLRDFAIKTLTWDGVLIQTVRAVSSLKKKSTEEMGGNMTFDPYHNRIPHGMLTDDEKAALEETGGPWEHFLFGEWHPVSSPRWGDDMIYRAVRKPAPAPQDGDIWVRTSNWAAEFWLQAKPNDPLAAALIADGYRLFREVKA
jgi:hypothetical protein